MPNRRNPKRAELIRKAKRYNWTPAQAAKRYGLNRGSVTRWFHEDGLEVGPRPGVTEDPTDRLERHREVIELYEQKRWTYRDIADITGYSISYVGKLIRGEA